MILYIKKRKKSFMILKFKDFVNEAIVVQNAPPKPVDYIYFRNSIQKELWDKVLREELWQFRNADSWFWKGLTSEVDNQNPRVTKQAYGNASIGFSKLINEPSVFNKLMQVAQAMNPDYSKRSLITDLNDISDICRSAASSTRGVESVVKAKKRILTGFDDKDSMRISDILKKAAGNKDKAEMLANKMAKAIDDGAKALRRGKAAEAAGEEDLASIFYGRAADLKFGDQWRASTSLRDMNKKLGLFDDDDEVNDDPVA